MFRLLVTVLVFAFALAAVQPGPACAPASLPDSLEGRVPILTASAG